MSQTQSAPSSDAAASSDAATPSQRGRRLHRRETRWQIYLPFTLAFVVIIAIFVVTALLPLRDQVSIIADWMFTLFVLCPMVLCLTPIMFLVVLSAYGANRLHDNALPPLERLENLTQTMNERVENITNKANQRVIGAQSRIAPLMRVMAIFTEQPAQPKLTDVRNQDSTHDVAAADDPTDHT